MFSAYAEIEMPYDPLIYAEYKNQNMCYRCHKKDSFSRVCKDCMDKQKARWQEMSPEQIAARKEYLKAYRKRKRQADNQ